MASDCYRDRYVWVGIRSKYAAWLEIAVGIVLIILILEVWVS